MEKLEIFKNELNLIQHKDIRKLVELCLSYAPSYFWSIPASSSGKRHPDFELGEGGLVIHTKMVVQWACKLMEREVGCVSKLDFDIIIASCICHDLIKRGWNPEETRSVAEHPTLAQEYIKDIASLNKIEGNFVLDISNCVASHMGIWNKDWKGNEILPLPKTFHEKIVHLADYCSACRMVVPEKQLLG